MGSEILLIVVGLVVLLVAGDLLVRGAVSLAAALHIPALLISLTIVAFGTSAPELVVTVKAVLGGNDGIAIGNIIGSNIANIFLVLGLPALIYPVTTHVPGLRRHVFLMLAATGAFVGAAYIRGHIGTTIGAVFFSGIVLYLIYMWGRARSGGRDPVIDEVSEYVSAPGVTIKTLAFLAAGLIGLPLGAQLLVTNGESLALGLGVRESIIGLTIIAFGTSLPELATVFAAAVHKKSDVAIGGVIGSNIFNVLAVGGAAGLAGTAEFDAATKSLDIPIMIGAAIILTFFVLTKRDIGRISGLAFLVFYAGFMFLLAKTSLGF